MFRVYTTFLFNGSLIGEQFRLNYTLTGWNDGSSFGEYATASFITFPKSSVYIHYDSAATRHQSHLRAHHICHTLGEMSATATPVTSHRSVTNLMLFYLFLCN